MRLILAILFVVSSSMTISAQSQLENCLICNVEGFERPHTLGQLALEEYLYRLSSPATNLSDIDITPRDARAYRNMLINDSVFGVIDAYPEEVLRTYYPTPARTLPNANDNGPFLLELIQRHRNSPHSNIKGTFENFVFHTYQDHAHFTMIMDLKMNIYEYFGPNKFRERPQLTNFEILKSNPRFDQLNDYRVNWSDFDDGADNFYVKNLSFDREASAGLTQPNNHPNAGDFGIPRNLPYDKVELDNTNYLTRLLNALKNGLRIGVR